MAAYVGRFAPSPTGPLHFGSLVAALASYLDARAHGGKWLVRIEDIDPPREQPGATKHILETLRRFSMHWDGKVLYQSARVGAYREAVEQLLASGHAYRCRCTRGTLRAAGIDVYRGTCRNANVPASEPHAIRIRVPDEPRQFTDLVQGSCETHLLRDIGDFIIWRRDNLPAYQIAVTLDDADQEITHIVRGADLLDSTPRQNYLREILDLVQPRFAHVPVAVDTRDQKLSKQTGAAAVAMQHAATALVRALEFLQQSPPPDLAQSAAPDILEWSVMNWNINALEGISAIKTDTDCKVVAY